jgi:hypothetical protein
MTDQTPPTDRPLTAGDVPLLREGDVLVYTGLTTWETFLGLAPDGEVYAGELLVKDTDGRKGINPASCFTFVSRPATSAASEVEGVLLSASDRACYEYPGVDEGPLRVAFVAGVEAYSDPSMQAMARSAEFRAIAAEGETDRISLQLDRLKLAICGGEDVPGSNNAVSVDDCVRFLNEERDAKQAALASTSAASEPVWRDVRRAPQDGSLILLNHRTHGIIQGWFSKGEWSDDTPISPREYSGDMWVLGDDLHQDEVEFGDGGVIVSGSVTGWLPLAALASPPVSERERELEGALRLASDLHAAYEQLIYGLPKYLESQNLTDEENMIREACITLDVTAHRLAALTAQPAGEGK